MGSRAAAANRTDWLQNRKIFAFLEILYLVANRYDLLLLFTAHKMSPLYI